MPMQGISTKPMSVQIPAGTEVSLSLSEQQEVAKKALEERLVRDLNRPYELTYGVADEAIRAIATIIGFGLGGFLAAYLMKRVGIEN